MAKSINLTKIEFLFSFAKNSFEGKRVCEAFGNVISQQSLFCGCSKETEVERKFQ